MMALPMGRRVLTLLAVLAALPVAVSGQGWVAGAQVFERHQSPAVGIGLVVDGGSALDRPGREGETWLWAQALAQAIVADRPAGRARRAEVEVLPDRWALRILVEPDDAIGVLRDLRARLNQPLPDRRGRTPGPTRDIVRLRERLSGAGDGGRAPRLIDGFESAWSRPTRGTAISISGLSASEVAAVGRAITPERSHIGVVGPVDRQAVLAVLGLPSEPAADSTAGVSAGASASELQSAPYPGAVIWSTSDRIRIVREVTNSWITVAFPIPADVPQTLLEFLAHRMDEEISTDPPDPGIFDAEVRILRRPGGRLLVVDAAVLPEAADRWEQKILGTAAVAAEPVQEAFFHWLRRRFRSTVLLRESAPEAMAQRLAEDLLMGIAPGRRIEEESWRLSPALLLDVARALGSPRILVYGPDFGSGGGL